MSEALRPGVDAELLAKEEAVQVRLGEWLRGHLEKDERMTLLDYDRLHYPFQRLDVHCYGPIEPSAEPVETARMVMGPTFDHLVEKMRQYVPLIKDRLARGENTLIITPHLEDILDTPIAEAALYCAYGDDSFANDSMILTGKIVSRLAINGSAAVDMMAPMGRVYMDVPGTGSARNADLDDETIKLMNWSMMREVANETWQDRRSHRSNDRGKVIHQAPSNTTAKVIPDRGRSKTLVIPKADRATAKFIARYKAYAIPVGLRLGSESTQSRWALGAPDHIYEPGDLHRMMGDLAVTCQSFFEDKIVEYRELEQQK